MKKFVTIVNFAATKAWRLTTAALLLALAVVALGAVASAQAQDVALEPIGRGHYEVREFRVGSGALSGNVSSYNSPFSAFITGSRYESRSNGGNPSEYWYDSRGFFVYNLPAAPPGQTLVAATLRLKVPNGSHGVEGAPLTVFVHDVDASLAQLQSSNAQFSDFGTGTDFGSRQYTEVDTGAFTEINLNAAGVAALNAALGGPYALSLRSSLEGTRDKNHVIFLGSGSISNVADGQTQLLLTWASSTGTLIINKQTAPAGGVDFGFVMTDTVGVSSTFALSDTEQITFANVPLGAYTVTEDAVVGGFLSGLHCDDGTSATPSTWDIATRTANIKLDAGETVTCTFTNSAADQIIIEKATLPTGGTGFAFSSNIPGAATFTLDDFGQQFASVTPGTYTITETNPGPTYDLTAIECAIFGPGPDDFTTVSGTLNTRAVSVPLTAPGQGTHCYFENTKRGSITVVKNSEGGDGSFNFTSQALGNFTLTTTSGTTQTVFSNLPLGTYDLSENNLPGWTFVGTPVCSNGSSPSSINLSAGENITCTFGNRKLASITVVKETEGGDGSFNFTSQVLGNFTLTTTNGATQTVFNNLQPDSYDLFEANQPGWAVVGIPVCSNSSFPSSINLKAGENITCTFKNRRQGTITIIKDAKPADDTNFFIAIGDPNKQPLSRHVQDPANPSFTLSGIPGLYQFREGPQPGWTLTGVDCQSALGTSTFDTKRFGVDVNLSMGDDVTCTIHNVKPGSLTVVKNAVGGDASFDFNSTTLGNFTLVTSNGSAQKSFGSLTPGAYDLAEVTPAGWRQESATCSDGSNPASVTVDPGEHVTCTFTNHQLNTIVVEKRTVGADGTFAYTSQALGNFQLKTAKGVARRNFSNLAPGTYAVTETVPAGWTATVADPTCTNGDKASSINLSAGETVVCTFVNLKQDTLVVAKRTVGGDGSFGFGSNLPGGAAFSLTTVNGAASHSFANLPSATYNISETVPTGWVQSGATCSDGSSPTSISLAPGAVVSCVFTNTKLSTITVVKRSVGGDAPFAFTGDLGNFALTTVVGAAQQSFSNLVAGTYTISETVPAGWDLVGTTCSDGSSPASVNLSPGEQVTCTFDNAKRGSLTIVKNATGDDAAFPFASRALGDFTVTTSQGIGQQRFGDLKPGTYDLAESALVGWRLNSATCSNGSAPAHVVVGRGENVVCTFDNTRLDTIVVVQRTVGGDDPFGFTSPALGNFSLTTVNGAAQRNFSNLAPGAYAVTANAAAGWTPAVADPVCSNGDRASNINMNAGETVVCTFVNTKQDTIVVEKRTVGGDDSFDFSSNLPGGANFSLTTSNGITRTTFSGLTPATYNIAESVPAGWVQTGASCDNGDAPASVSLTPGATVSCVFTNTKLAKVVVIKHSLGGDETFEFTGDLGSFSIKTANGSAKRDFFDLAAGTYLITETVPSGWDLSRAVCSDGSSPAAINLTAGEELTCLFENTAQGRITVVKNTVGSDGAFDFTSQTLGNFDLATANGAAQQSFDNLTPGIYDVSESVPTGWGLVSATCSNGSPPAAISLGAGENVTCTFVNVTTAQLTIQGVYLPLILRDGVQSNASGSYLPMISRE